MDAAHPRSAKRRYVAAEERQRAIRACAECRRLKEKCADGIPCRRCRHLRRACEVAPVPAPAERVTPDFAGSLKELMDRLRCMGFILKHHFPDLALDTESLRRTCDALASRTPRLDQHDNTVEWAEPLADARPADSSPGIEDEDCTIDSVDDTTVHYSGEFSHWNFSMHIKRNLDELMAKSNAPSLDNVNQVPEFIRVGEADPGSTSITDIVAIIPPRPVATFLINVFFKHATSIYYFVDRGWLDGFLDLIYNNARELRSKDVTAACVVLMVIAVGTQYVHLESPQKQRRCSTNGPATTNTQGGWELEIGSVFYRQVAKLLSEVIHSGSQLSVQVFLLLGLYYLPLDASGLSYIYLNLAIKIAIQNGMHRNVSRRSFDPRTKEIRRRIWWTSYCMERKIGIYHGRPTSIARSDIDVDLPRSPGANNLNDDSFDSSGLLESIHLTGQAELFLQEISRLRTCAKSEIRTIFNRIKLMKTNLQGRWSPSPTDVPSTSATNQAERPNSRAEIHARLECCLLHMFIGRPFILAHRHVHTRVIVPEASAPPRSNAPEPHVQWTFLVQDCVAAAKEVINLCHILQTGRMGLAKSSYTEYSSCRASLLVLIAYSICYRTNEFASTLERGLGAIREMASVGDSARSEVSLLEALEAALHRLRVFDPLPDQSTDTADDNSAEEGYAGFLDWYNKLGGPANSRGGSNHNGNGGQSAKAQQSCDTGPQMGPIISNPGVTGLSSDSSIDTYPFDFDLLNTEGSAAFFTPDFNEHGNPERELFENLLWIPR